jgi:hypothetical protein
MDCLWPAALAGGRLRMGWILLVHPAGRNGAAEGPPARS